MSDSVFNLGKFKFRSTSAEVDVFFHGEEPKEEQAPALIHSESDLEDSYQRGQEDAKGPLEEQIRDLQQQMNELQQAQAEREKVITEAFQGTLLELEKQMIDNCSDMSFVLAEMIINCKIAEKDVLSGMVRNILAEIQSGSETLVKLCPQDCEVLSPILPSSTIKCIADHSLNQGDLQIEQQDGYWDASIKNRLSGLREEFDKIALSGEEDV